MAEPGPPLAFKTSTFLRPQQVNKLYYLILWARYVVKCETSCHHHRFWDIHCKTHFFRHFFNILLLIQVGIITMEPVIHRESTPLLTEPKQTTACIPGYVMATWKEEQLDQVIAAHKGIAFARTVGQVPNRSCS